MIEFSLLQKITVWILPVLFAITVHETAHGWVASLLGDNTAKMLGRLTLNPIKHIDPVGTLLIPAMTLMLVGFIFGYAKPVPVVYQNLRNPKRDMTLVALAGPSSNLLMALFWTLVVKLSLMLPEQYLSVTVFLAATGIAGILVNLILMVLNMIPLPPLDGGRVLTGILPMPYSASVARLEPYGFVILVGLLLFGVLGKMIWPVIEYFMLGLAHLAGISNESLGLFLHAIGALGA